MKKLLAGILLSAALAGCGPKHANFVKVDDVALGRVVIYRNGVAYYERRATVSGGVLTVSVPRDRVDDFLKSLTVVDAITRKPLPVSIPRQQANDGDYLVMKLQLPSENKADVVLTYVTESPAWKPSYRVVVGEKAKGQSGKVFVEADAIVDNTSGEDWNGVIVGVGSSSALSFKYDLWSVRTVQRETLNAEEKFAVAPPSGVSPYGGQEVGGEVALADFADDEIRRPQGHPDNPATKSVAMADDEDGDADVKAAEPTPPPEMVRMDADYTESVETSSSGGGSVADFDKPAKKQKIRAARKKAPKKEVAMREERPRVSDGRVTQGDAKMKAVADQIAHSNKTIAIQSFGNANEPDAERRAQDRANILKNQLIDQGVPPARIKVETKLAPNQSDAVKLVAIAPSQAEQAAKSAASDTDMSAQPVGESHFTSEQPMTVERGASAMVSMMRQETSGEVVYLYDAESVRGNASFAFRAVRFMNPTESTLEAGPVTVYGDERFIGEGLTEAVPPKSSAVVPFALDKQIVVERNDGEEDKLQKITTLQRGVVTAEVQHIKRTKLTLTNRLREPAKVFLRHTVNKGWTLLDSPKTYERVGDAHLFAIDLGAHEVKTIEISEATPVERTLDLNADVTLDMMRVYVDAPESTPALRDELKKLLDIHKKLVDLTEESASLRRRQVDYRARMDELHAQIVTLQMVKTGNDLMSHLKAKMREISDRVQKTTIQLVDQEEKIMLARVSFQDALSELSLPDALAQNTTPAK
ncbi:MAG TPA: hypothetical protein VGM90_32235 [Kofleriaceae bacterium]|jgi:hypothetical protein